MHRILIWFFCETEDCEKIHVLLAGDKKGFGANWTNRANDSNGVLF